MLLALFIIHASHFFTLFQQMKVYSMKAAAYKNGLIIYLILKIVITFYHSTKIGHRK